MGDAGGAAGLAIASTFGEGVRVIAALGDNAARMQGRASAAASASRRGASVFPLRLARGGGWWGPNLLRWRNDSGYPIAARGGGGI